MFAVALLLLLCISVRSTKKGWSWNAATKSRVPVPDRSDHGVMEVGSNNIQEFLTESPKGMFLLEFYAPWCGHCQRFASALEELAHEFHEEGSYYVGRVDISNNDALAGRFEINQIPSLYLRSDDKNLYAYTSGQFTKSAVKEWVRRGHKKTYPLSGLSSPLGLIGQLKGGFTHAGVIMHSYATFFSELLGIPEMWVFVGVALFWGLFVASFALFVAIFLIEPHDKND